MKKKLPLIVASALITVTATSHALANDENVVSTFATTGMKLSDLDDVKQALATGAIVRAAIDLTKCTLASGGPTRNQSGGLTIDSYLVERDGTLRFSTFRTTLSSRADVAVTQNNKYKVKTNGDVTFTSSVFSMPDYNLTSKVDVSCKLNDSFNFYLAY